MGERKKGKKEEKKTETKGKGREKESVIASGAFYEIRFYPCLTSPNFLRGTNL